MLNARIAESGTAVGTIRILARVGAQAGFADCGVTLAAILINERFMHSAKCCVGANGFPRGQFRRLR